MVERAVREYYKFFDETIQSSTFIVLMISCLIFAVGGMSPSVNASDFTWDILWWLHSSENISHIFIDGVEYEINLTKIQ